MLILSVSIANELGFSNVEKRETLTPNHCRLPAAHDK